MTTATAGEKDIDRHIINWYDTFESNKPICVPRLKMRSKIGSYSGKSF